MAQQIKTKLFNEVIIGLGFQLIGSVPFFLSSIPIPCFSFTSIFAISKIQNKK